MDAQQIKTFIDAMAASSLDEMEVSHEGWTLRLSRNGAGAPARPSAASKVVNRPKAAAPVAAAPEAASHELQAPLFGVVHLQPSPGEPPFVRAGDLVEAGQMICTIEAMKVFNEVRAERAGRVASVLVATGTEVEAGQPLLVLEPSHV